MPNAYRYNRILDRKIHFIYPGNPYKKDSLSIMLLTFDGLASDEKEKICFHLTGADKVQLEKAAGKFSKILDSDWVKIHPWLDYRDLQRLYEMMDYAFIARPRNSVTESNFPSKIPELLAKGIPIITNDVGDVVQYLTDNVDSFIAQENAADEFITIIRKCINRSDEELCSLHLAAYEKAKKVFDYKASAEVLNEYFRQGTERSCHEELC